MSKLVVVNPFAKRHTENSSYSYFKGSWEELEDLVELFFPLAIPGDKPGSLLVPVGRERLHSFRTGTTKLTSESVLTPFFKPRRPMEEPFVGVTAVGPKTQASKVDIVLYSHDLLADDSSSDAEWEVISINASVYTDEPMDPITMMRNFLVRPGGTKAEYTAEQFAASILFWSQHAMLTPT